MGKNNQRELTTADVYNLIGELRQEASMNVKSVEDKVDRVNDKVDGVSTQVANINGRLMVIPFLISTAISVFFFIINYLTNK